MKNERVPEAAPNYIAFLRKPEPCTIIPGMVQREEILVRNKTTVHGGPLIRAFQSAAYNEGFTRTVQNYARKHCDECAACLPARVLLDEFNLSASQRQVMRTNHDISFSTPDKINMAEHIDLFMQYYNRRHAWRNDQASNETMNDPQSVAKLMNAFFAMEFRDARGKLVGGMLYDITDEGLGAIKSYYDTDASKKRSLGIYMVLMLAEYARRQDRSYLYLGALTREPSSMHYKTRFRPLEVMNRTGSWQRLEHAS